MKQSRFLISSKILKYRVFRFFIKAQVLPSHPKATVLKRRRDTSNATPGEISVHHQDMAENSNGHDDWRVALKRSVKLLHFGSLEEKDEAAEEIKKLAEEDVERGETVALLGVVPPLAAMLVSEVVSRWRLAVGALIVLANGSFRNKALMVEAGILSKIPENICALSETDKQQYSQLLLSISALAKIQFSTPLAGIIPIIVSILDSNPNTTVETRELCLATLYNLSSILDNVTTFVDTRALDILIRMSSIKEVSEKSLATLGNFVVTTAGRRSVERDVAVPECFIEIMRWEDKPKCQELSCYILMVLAHQSSLQRRKMAEAGIVQVLLGLVLLGSPLAQKRALRVLQWFKDERQVMKMGRVASLGSPDNLRPIDEGQILMRKFVRQSLYRNMEVITRRANRGGHSSTSLKALEISSSSKSMPY